MDKDFEWAQNYYQCIECQTTEKPHAAHGLCRSCYMKTDDQRLRRQFYREANPHMIKKHKRRYLQTPEGRNKTNKRARERYALKKMREGKTYKPHKVHKTYTSKLIDPELMAIKLGTKQREALAKMTEEQAQKQFFTLLDMGILQEKHAFEFMNMWRVLNMSGEELINKLVDDFGEKPQKENS